MGKPFRIGVVGVFQNSKGELLVCERSNRAGAWQFPQGGIDDGESPDEALEREVREELGTGSFTIKGKADELTEYTFPEGLEFKIARNFCGQKHHWYLLEFIDGAEPNLDKSDHEFCAWKWVPISESLDAVIYWKKEAYGHGLRLLGLS